MHRTKCTNIITNVLCPHFEKELIDNIDGNKICLLLDESNDISIIKLLGVSIMHFSHASNKVESTYLGHAQLTKCNAGNIVTALKKLVVTKNHNITNCIAMGTGNASVMVGINNGVCSKLKQENPSLMSMRCVCHSIQLAMSHASAEFMPKNMEYSIAETHNWIHNNLYDNSNA